MTGSRAVGWAVAMAGTVVLALPASAQMLGGPGMGNVTSTSDIDRGVRACTSLSSSASETIDGCTTVIEAGGAWNLSLANAYFDRAMGFRARRDYGREIADLDQAVRLNPMASAYAARAIAWNRKGDHARAFADFDQALRLKPDLVEALLGRSTEFACRGDRDHELADADQVISLMPHPARAFVVHVAQAYANRASALAFKDDYDGARLAYDRAIELYPQRALFYFGRALVWGRQHERDRELADLDKAIELDPRYAAAYGARGGVWLAKGADDRALHDLDAAIRFDPDLADAYYNRALVWDRKGDSARAGADREMARRLAGGAAPSSVHALECASAEPETL